MGAVYTNITSITHGGNAMENVKAISVNDELTLLYEQSDGARTPAACGNLTSKISGSVELSETAALTTYLGYQGFSNKGNIAFVTQLDSAVGTTKTHTITDAILTTLAYSTSQDNPNGYTYNWECTDEGDTWSIS